jgi:tripartite-type tricarboxylate transporter receptor subunit TctC
MIDERNALKTGADLCIIRHRHPHQIFAEQFKTMTGTDIHHIPYKGAVPGLTDVASGNVSMAFVDIPPALPLIHAGKLKVLAVLSAKGNSELAGVPPLAETVAGYDASSWQGFFARAGNAASYRR